MLHDITKYVYLKTLKLLGIQVLTDTGFRDVVSINKTRKQRQYIVKTDKTSLKCSGRHILITADNREIYAKDSLGAEIRSIDGNAQVVTDVIETDENDCLFDLSLSDDSDHLYYCNGLLSHNCVIMDEAAFVPNNIASKVFESIYPVISSSKNSQFIMVSTPNGADPNNLYYSIWQKANSKNKENSEGWKAFRFDWWEVPGRDEQWKEATVASIGERRFAQEFGNEFVASGTSHKLIPDDILERYRMKISEYKTKGIKPKKTVILAQTQDKAFEFEMWKGFDQTHTYMASADIAEGVGGDSSVLYVWDVTDLSCIKMCAKFESNTVSTVEFAFVCNRILGLYGNPYLFAERNGISGAMLDSLRITYGYQNIARESKNGEPGIYSHITIKERAVLWCRDMMTTQGFGFEIYDKALIDEFDTFVKKDNKGMHTIFTAASGAHDDMVMAFVWACWALSKEVIEKYFIICSTFNTMYGDVLPRSLQPMNMYSPNDISRITNDPIYKDFLEFRNQLSETARQMFTNQQIEEKRDLYKYTDDDIYFGDQWDGPSWNNSSRAGMQSVNPNNIMPMFFIT